MPIQFLRFERAQRKIYWENTALLWLSIILIYYIYTVKHYPTIKVCVIAGQLIAS